MDVRRILGEPYELAQRLQQSLLPEVADAHVHRDSSADLARGRPLPYGRVEAGELGSGRGERQGEQLIGRGEMLPPEPPNVVGIGLRCILEPWRHQAEVRAIPVHRAD